MLNFSSAIIASQHFLICFFNCYGGGGAELVRRVWYIFHRVHRELWQITKNVDNLCLKVSLKIPKLSAINIWKDNSVPNLPNLSTINAWKSAVDNKIFRWKKAKSKRCLWFITKVYTNDKKHSKLITKSVREFRNLSHCLCNTQCLTTENVQLFKTM